MSEIEYSERGFALTGEVKCSYGGTIRAYASSAASGPCIWVNVVTSEHITRPPGEGVVHLPLLQAMELRDNLTALIDQAMNSWEDETIRRALAGDPEPNYRDE